MAADGADALVIVTEWDAFRALDLGRIKSLLKTPLLVDLRNIYPPAEAERYRAQMDTTRGELLGGRKAAPRPRARVVSNFHTVVINLGILENFGKFWIFSGRFGPRGGRKRILREK